MDDFRRVLKMTAIRKIFVPEFRSKIEELIRLNPVFAKTISFLQEIFTENELDEILVPYSILSEEESSKVIEIMENLYSYDKLLFNHSARVGAIAAFIGKLAGCGNCRYLFWAGFLHDTGKFFIPDEILYKPEKLTDEEFETMKTHSVEGSRFLLRSGITDRNILDVAKFHHKTYDGNGYPNVLEEPVNDLYQVVAIADSFDAMADSRVYSEGKMVCEIVEQLVRGMGKQFNPEYALATVKESDYIYYKLF